MDNKTRRDAELPYISDLSIMVEQTRTRILIRKYNKIFPWRYKKRVKFLRKILSKNSEDFYVEPPFHCDYGFHIEVGKNSYANYNFTVLDVGEVKIGDYVMIGPNVSLYTAGHPIHPQARRSSYEYGIGITIGNNVWIGGDTVVLPGVNIGDNVVIGAGSVVTHNIPNNVVAVGNPCKVLRNITDEDINYYYKDRKFDDETLAKIKENKCLSPFNK